MNERKTESRAFYYQIKVLCTLISAHCAIMPFFDNPPIPMGSDQILNLISFFLMLAQNTDNVYQSTFFHRGLRSFFLTQPSYSAPYNISISDCLFVHNLYLLAYKDSHTTYNLLKHRKVTISRFHEDTPEVQGGSSELTKTTRCYTWVKIMYTWIRQDIYVFAVGQRICFILISIGATDFGNFLRLKFG